MNCKFSLHRALSMCAFLFFSNNYVWADIATTVSVLKNHPQVLGERAKSLASEARVAQQSAQWLPNVSLSTDGGQRIFGSADSSQLRSIGDNGYTDLVVTGRQLLYDFGAVNGYIDEAKYRSHSDAFLYDISLNRLIGDLLQLAAQFEVEQERLQIINRLISPLEDQSELAKQRFEAGVSSGDDYRRIEMDIDRLNRDRLESDRRLKDVSQKLAEQFSLKIDDVLELHSALNKLPSSKTNGSRLSDESRRLRELAAQSRVNAAQAERKPRIELELELRGFDVAKNYVSDNELTGNLQVTMPFFDGGALRAKAEVAEFERTVVQQEIAFEQRVLRERTAQIEEELGSLVSVNASLTQQRKTASEALAMSLERQGKTAVEISQIQSGLMSIYQMDSELLESNLRVQQLNLELVTLNERWPAKVNQVVLALEK